MATVVTINRPDVVALIEEAAKKMTGGNKTEAVALAMRRLLEQGARATTCSELIKDRFELPKAWISSHQVLTLSRTQKPAGKLSNDDRGPAARGDYCC